MTAELPLFNKYCIDSCALIDLWHRDYPPATFPTLWKELTQMVDNGEIVSTIEVYNELEPQHDELSKWVKQHKNMFIDIDCPQLDVLRTIYNKYPSMVLNTSKTSADAFLVALAKIKELTVITSELKSINPSLKNPKVPNLCDEFCVKWINLVNFFKVKGWRF